PLKLHITADKAGEIHVHSSPEQHIEYTAGTTDKTLTIDQPGVIDVESHSLDKPIPLTLAISGAVAALVVSFCVLALAWRQPRYEGPRPGRPVPGVERVVD